jgi:RNA polymerase-binding transcription factor DksA
VAKPIAKAVPKKAVTAKAKAPVKKVAAPAKKVSKPIAKPVAKKAIKPVAKKPIKPVAKKVTKVVAKVVAKVIKKAVPAKDIKSKAAKPVTKQPLKPVAVAKKVAPTKNKPTPVKKAEVKKPVATVVTKTKATIPTPPMKSKKEETKKAPIVEAPKAKKAEAAKPVEKAPVIKAMAKNPKDIKIPAAKPVVIPNFATKTVRKYDPDFMKSVLDIQKNDPGAPMVRYSDNDLQEFRDLIHRKIDSAKKELNYLQGLITRKDENGGDESENRYMTMEDGSLSMEREQLSQMASRQITFIDHLEKALMRIESKTYGVCRVTGKLIDKARLRAVPHATLSIEAKMGIVK